MRDRGHGDCQTIPLGMGASRLPDLVTAAHLAAALNIDVSSASRQIRQGVFGPRVKVGRRYVVLRETLLATLKRQERQA